MDQYRNFRHVGSQSRIPLTITGFSSRDQTWHVLRTKTQCARLRGGLVPIGWSTPNFSPLINLCLRLSPVQSSELVKSLVGPKRGNPMTLSIPAALPVTAMLSALASSSKASTDATSEPWANSPQASRSLPGSTTDSLRAHGFGDHRHDSPGFARASRLALSQHDPLDTLAAGTHHRQYMDRVLAQHERLSSAIPLLRSMSSTKLLPGGSFQRLPNNTPWFGSSGSILRSAPTLCPTSGAGTAPSLSFTVSAIRFDP